MCRRRALELRSKGRRNEDEREGEGKTNFEKESSQYHNKRTRTRRNSFTFWDSFSCLCRALGGGYMWRVKRVCSRSFEEKLKNLLLLSVDMRELTTPHDAESLTDFSFVFLCRFFNSSDDFRAQFSSIVAAFDIVRYCYLINIKRRRFFVCVIFGFLGHWTRTGKRLALVIWVCQCWESVETAKIRAKSYKTRNLDEKPPWK